MTTDYKKAIVNLRKDIVTAIDKSELDSYECLAVIISLFVHSYIANGDSRNTFLVDMCDLWDEFSKMKNEKYSI